MYKSISTGVLVFTFVLSTIAKPTEFTEIERAALEKFRPLVSDILVWEYQKDDNFLIRWIREKKFDLPAAAKMLREAQRWRKENNIDNILNETIIDLKHPPYTIDGFDKEGSPVIIFSPMELDPRKYLRHGQATKVIRYWDRILEEGGVKLRAAQAAMINSTEKYQVTQVVSILDLHGFNARQHLCLQCVSVYIEWVLHFERYHPQSVKYFVMINSPRAAVPVIEIIRPLLSSSTRKGFRVFGPNKKEWSQFLLSIIPADQLTFRFGGTKKNLPE